MQFDKKDIIRLTIAAALLIAGGMIYVIFRSEKIILFGWLDALGLSSAVEVLRKACASLSPGRFILYSLPDGLWLTSYLLIINTIISRDDKWLWLGFTLLLPVYAICNEVLQGLGICQGSFDPYDLVCYSVPLAVDLIICLGRRPSSVHNDT